MPSKAHIDYQDRLMSIGPRAADCWLKGQTYKQIGEKFGVTYDQSRQLIRGARKLWRKKNERRIATKVEEELRRLDLIESEAWSAWERSQRDAVMRTCGVNDRSMKKRQTQKRSQVGDAGFLEIVLKCIEARCRIIGANEPDPSKANAVPFGILVVVDDADQADRVLSYEEFERVRALASEQDNSRH